MRPNPKTDSTRFAYYPMTEENDLPFAKNELRDQPGSMGKPLDTADAPGRADSEFADEALEQVPARTM
jgi:hypothetical protein